MPISQDSSPGDSPRRYQQLHPGAASPVDTEYQRDEALRDADCCECVESDPDMLSRQYRSNSRSEGHPRPSDPTVVICDACGES